MVRKLQQRFHDMIHNGISIQLMWIPSHVGNGISGNEEVDELAKRAAKQQPEFIFVTYTDWYLNIN